MKAKKLLGIILFFAVVTLMVSGAAAQQPAKPMPGPENTNSEQAKLIVKGKITLLGGRYYVMGQNPPGELLIENTNSKILGELLKSGKTLLIEGHTTLSADLFFIEKIEGQPYLAEEQSTTK